MLVRGGCHRDLGDDVIAAYEAPYPTAESKAGARAFPLMIPTGPEMPGAAAPWLTVRTVAPESGCGRAALAESRNVPPSAVVAPTVVAPV